MKSSINNQAGILTPREVQIMEYLPSKTNWEIGRILGCSERTIVNHIENIKRKLKAHSKTHLLAMAVARGIITINLLLLCFLSIDDDFKRLPRHRKVERTINARI